MKMSWKRSIFVALGVFFLVGFNGMREGGQKAQARTMTRSYVLPKYYDPSASYRSTSRASLSYRSKSRPSISRPSRSRPSLSVPSKSLPSFSNRAISKTWL
jgi:hypothetical protein